MVPTSSRPITICRRATGTKSDTSAMASGKLPPQAAPAMMRRMNSCGKLVTTAHRNDDTESTSTQAIITRSLPSASATGPSTGSARP